MIERAGVYEEVAFIKDYGGHDRVVCAQRKTERGQSPAETGAGR